MFKKLLIILLTFSFLNAAIEEIQLKLNTIKDESTITKKLFSLNGIKEVKINKKNKINIKLTKTNKLSLISLKSAIEKNLNYKITTMKITATGKISKINKYYALEENANKILIAKVPTLTIHAEKEENSSFLLTTKNLYYQTMNFFKNFRNTEEKFSQNVRLHCKHNASVKVSGYVITQTDGSFKLSSIKSKIDEINDNSDLLDTSNQA